MINLKCAACGKSFREAELVEAADDTQYEGALLCKGCDWGMIEAALKSMGIGDPLAEILS